MEVMPTSLSVDQGQLMIRWSDSTNQSIDIGELRRRCPCANCREQRSNEILTQDQEVQSPALNVLPMEKARPLTIDKMEPAGNYAYIIQFSDGHSNGLFTFDFLRSITND